MGSLGKASSKEWFEDKVIAKPYSTREDREKYYTAFGWKKIRSSQAVKSTDKYTLVSDVEKTLELWLKAHLEKNYKRYKIEDIEFGFGRMKPNGVIYDVREIKGRKKLYKDELLLMEAIVWYKGEKNETP